MANPKPLAVGTNVDSYTLESVVEQNDYHVLYRAAHTQSGKKVLIQELLPRALVSRRTGGRKIQTLKDSSALFKQALSFFKNQSTRLKALRHPNVCQADEFFKENNTAYLVLASVSFYTLQSALDKKGTIKSDIQIHALLTQLLHGLEVCHKAGLFHLNLNPDNIWITDDGQAQLSGFFGATFSMRPSDRNSIISRFSSYQPIELMSDEDSIGPWSDLYSLGATLYHCIIGHPPVHANDRWSEVQQNQPDPVDELAKSDTAIKEDHLLGLIDWMLQISAHARPSSSTATLVAICKTESPANPAAKNRSTVQQVTFDNVAAVRQRTSRILRSGGKFIKKGPKPTNIINPLDVIRKTPHYGLFIILVIGMLSVLGFLIKPSDESSDNSEQLILNNHPIKDTINNELAAVENGEFVLETRPTELNIANQNDTTRAQAFRTLVNIDNIIEQQLRLANDNLALNQLTIPPGENALENYRIVLKYNPNNSDALEGVDHIVGLLLEQSIAAAKNNLFKRAYTLIEKATDLDPEHPDIDDIKTDINDYKQAILQPDLIVSKGDQIMSNDAISESDADSALIYYFMVLKKSPNHTLARDGVIKVVDYFLNQAKSSIRSGNTIHANQYLAKVISIEPDNPIAHTLIQQIQN